MNDQLIQAQQRNTELKQLLAAKERNIELKKLLADKENSSSERSTLETVGHESLSVPHGLAKGLAQTADFISYPIRKPLEAVSGRTIPTLESQLPDYKAETTPGRIVHKTSEFLGGGVGGAGIGKTIAKSGIKGAQKIGNFFGNPTSQAEAKILAKGTAGAGVAAGSLREMGIEEPFADLGGALGVGLAPSAYKGIKRIAQRGIKGSIAERINKTLQLNPEKIETFGDIPYSAGDVSDSQVLQMYQNNAAKKPGGSGVLKKFYEKQSNAFKDKLGAQNPINEEDAGDLIYGSAKKQHESHNKKMNLLEETYEKGLQAPNDLVEVPNTLDFNKKNIGNARTQTEKDLYFEYPSSKLARKVEDMASEIAALDKPGFRIGKESLDFKKHPHLKEMIEKSLEKELGNISANKVPYKTGIREIQRKIDDMVSTYGQIGNISQGQLKQLRGVIKQDLTNHFDTIGGEANQAWKTYNKEGHLFIKNKKPIINEIYKANEKSLTHVLQDALRARNSNPHKLRVIYEGLSPESKTEVFGSFINNLGKKGTNQFNPFAVKREFNNLPVAHQNILLKGLSDSNSKKHFRSALKALEHANEKNLVANTSATEYYRGLNEYVDNARDIVTDIATGTPGLATAKKVIGAVTPYFGAKALTSPSLLKWVHQTSLKNNKKDLLRQLDKLKDIPDSYISHDQKFLPFSKGKDDSDDK